MKFLKSKKASRKANPKKNYNEYITSYRGVKKKDPNEQVIPTCSGSFFFHTAAQLNISNTTYYHLFLQQQ